MTTREDIVQEAARAKKWVEDNTPAFTAITNILQESDPEMAMADVCGFAMWVAHKQTHANPKVEVREYDNCAHCGHYGTYRPVDDPKGPLRCWSCHELATKMKPVEASDAPEDAQK